MFTYLNNWLLTLIKQRPNNRAAPLSESKLKLCPKVICSDKFESIERASVCMNSS